MLNYCNYLRCLKTKQLLLVANTICVLAVLAFANTNSQAWAQTSDELNQKQLEAVKPKEVPDSVGSMDGLNFSLGKDQLLTKEREDAKADNRKYVEKWISILLNRTLNFNFSNFKEVFVENRANFSSTAWLQFSSIMEETPGILRFCLAEETSVNIRQQAPISVLFIGSYPEGMSWRVQMPITLLWKRGELVRSQSFIVQSQVSLKEGALRPIISSIQFK